jgi:hypothetical protein
VLLEPQKSGGESYSRVLGRGVASGSFETFSMGKCNIHMLDMFGHFRIRCCQATQLAARFPGSK